MASLGRGEQAQSVFNNPFSIKSILNLSEEPQDKCAHVSNEQTHPIFPVVPEAVRPPVARYNIVNIQPASLASYSTAQWLSAASHLPPFLLGTRFMRFLPDATPYLQRRRHNRKRKHRPLFTQKQVHTLEQEFARHRYVSEEKRAELASNLNLTETQVKTWFQNRRTKWRKEARDELETVLMDSKRRWKQDSPAADESLPSSSSTTSSSIASPGTNQLFIDLGNYKLKPT